MSQTHPQDGLDVDTVEIARDEEWFVASAKGTDIASQGKTVPEALENLAEALQLHEEGVPDDLEAPEPDAPWFDE
jgi:predicted RNase H-like HicB family nuclease